MGRDGSEEGLSCHNFIFHILFWSICTHLNLLICIRETPLIMFFDQMVELTFEIYMTVPHEDRARYVVSLKMFF